MHRYIVLKLTIVKLSYSAVFNYLQLNQRIWKYAMVELKIYSIGLYTHW